MPERILLVDDELVSRVMLQTLLADAGYDVEEAVSGEAALAAIARQRPDLILLDILMPGLSGLEVCRALKRQEETAGIPVIFLSGMGDVKDKIAGLEAGGVDYVAKPFDPAEVLARVRGQLHIQSLTRQLRVTNDMLTQKQALLDADLAAAAEIQRSLLPGYLPDLGPVRLAWSFRPSQQIGGDIFSVVQLPAGQLGLYILDVSGHGVSSALVAVAASQALRPQGGLIDLDNVATGPVEVLTRLDAMFPLERFERYFTLFYMLVDPATGAVRYCGGGHPPGLLLRRDGALESLDVGGPLVGLGGVAPYEEGEARLFPGDRIVLYTDGVTEYEDGEQRFFGLVRLQQALAALPGRSAEAVVAGLEAALVDFGGQMPPKDDISLLCLAYD